MTIIWNKKNQKYFNTLSYIDYWTYDSDIKINYSSESIIKDEIKDEIKGKTEVSYKEITNNCVFIDVI